MLDRNPFLGILFVTRHASGQSRLVFQHPPNTTDNDRTFGIGKTEFGKFALPALWLMNRKLDFEIEQCGLLASNQSGIGSQHDWSHLRFVSFPCDCEESAWDASASQVPLVSAFNIVFVFDSKHLEDSTAELYWQALATLSRALIVEERRCRYISEQVSLILSGHENSLSSTFVSVHAGLCSENRAIALYVNGSILTHLSIIPLSEAPDPPAGHQALLLLGKADSLQEQLPVDAASNVRRLIDASDPSKTIKDHMIELGLPMSTIQRISQHLVFWNKARIVMPLNKRLVLGLCSREEKPWSEQGICPTSSFMAEFRLRFGINKPGLFFAILHAFSKGKRLSDIKESLSEEIPQLSTKFNELCSFLLSNGVLAYSKQFFRYFPPTKRPGGAGFTHHRPKYQNLLPHEIRSEYSPIEFEIIFERLKFNSAGSELMIKFISKYVKRHKDLMTARVELNEQNRCTNEDFHRYTEALTSGFLDSLLIKYECDESYSTY